MKKTRVYCKDCKYNSNYLSEFCQQYDIVKNQFTGVEKFTKKYKNERNGTGECKFYEKNDNTK